MSRGFKTNPDGSFVLDDDGQFVLEDGSTAAPTAPRRTPVRARAPRAPLIAPEPRRTLIARD